MDRASLEELLGLGLSLDEIGRRFGRHESTVAYWADKYGLRAVNRDKHEGKGGLARDELGRLVEAGMSIAEIAKAVDRSTATVRHWLNRYKLRTTAQGQRRGEKSTRAAKEAGHVTVRRECRHHGLTDFWLEGRGYYRCERCRWEAVVRRRRKVKQVLVEDAGGRCKLCGYDRYIGALHFHHVDPASKSFHLSEQGVTRSLAVARAEAGKCVLLCSNCHAEVEAGVVSLLPLTTSP
jgi:transposase